MLEFLVGLVSGIVLVFVAKKVREAFSGSAEAFKADVQAIKKEV